MSGARGSVTLTSWTGTLPPGAQVSYDSGAEQIVVTWPAYSPGSNADIPNLDFQSGDVGFADGAGIDIRNIPGQNPVDPSAPDDTWYMHYQNVGGESNAMSTAYIRAVPGKTYAASVDLWRASTRKHADGGAVRILFYDANKNQIDGQDGNVVKEQTDRQWHTSSVSKVAPANVAFVRLGVSFFRIHDNDEVLAANLQWNGAFVDGTQAQGTDGTDPYLVTFSVRDSMGCRATLTGAIAAEPGQIIANLYFNTSLTDDPTGRLWEVTQASTFPKLSTGEYVDAPSAMMPTDASNYSSSYGYVSSELGADAFRTDVDFCFEGFLYLDPGDEANLSGNLNTSFAKIGVPSNSGTGLVGLWASRANGGASRSFDVAAVAVTGPLTDVSIGYDRWYHWAMTREGSVMRFWFDGRLAYTADGGVLDFLSSYLLVVGSADSPSNAVGFPGWIDAVRVTRGWARYTMPFTPAYP